MGMYDVVWVPCPHCDERVEFQSKKGTCALIDYTLDDAPNSILNDIAGRDKVCDKCGRLFSVVVKCVVFVRKE